MELFPLSFKGVNKMVLLIAIASLAYKRGHFAGTHIPSPFQVFFILSIVLTTIYVVKEYSVKEFFNSFPRKILIAVGCLFVSVLIGWGIGSTVAHLPNTQSAVSDFATFTVSCITFLLVLFYTKDDKRFATWCLYALLIPNIYPFFYFFTHGFVGYWGVVNDGSLTGLVDSNLYSKTLLIPALFFTSLSLFSYKSKKLLLSAGYIFIASLYCMLILWTASRGSAFSLIGGLLLLWCVFSLREFSWKKLLSAGLIILITLSLSYGMLPYGTQQELRIKILSTGLLPHSERFKNVLDNPSITVEELRANPRTDVRLYEWSFFAKYGSHYPLGVGPSVSSVDFQPPGELQLKPGNTYIQVWLWGGIIALLSFVYILRGAFVALWKRWKATFSPESLALMSILCALSIAILFDASLYFYWYFIILALAFEGIKAESGNN